MLKILADHKEFETTLNKMKPIEIMQFQSRLWDYAMDKGREVNPDFTRRDLTVHLQPCTDYMYRVGCTFDPAYCRSKICFKSNPNCASRKAKSVINTLRKVVLERF